MRGDKRKARRHRLRRDAWVMLDAGQRCECVITNISDRGAHISIADSDALPDSFVLLLADEALSQARQAEAEIAAASAKLQSEADDARRRLSADADALGAAVAERILGRKAS